MKKLILIIPIIFLFSSCLSIREYKKGDFKDKKKIVVLGITIEK